MRFNITDCELHTDAIHRGGGQIMPTARRLYYALELLSAPTLLEPIFLCQITAPMDCMGGVYQTLNQRRGEIIEDNQIAGTPLSEVPIHLFLDQGLSARRRILRLHRNPERKHSRQGFPPERVRPLGSDQGHAPGRPQGPGADPGN
jgi:hypothetical protein